MRVGAGAVGGGRGRQGDGEGVVPRAAGHAPQPPPRHHLPHQGEETEESVYLLIC